MIASATRGVVYQLRFSSLFNSGRGFVFPCDPHGRIATDKMSASARTSYLRVSALVGREFAAPVVGPAQPTDQELSAPGD